MFNKWLKKCLGLDLSTQEAEAGDFKASLVYRASFQTARVTQRNPVSKNKQTNTKNP